MTIGGPLGQQRNASCAGPAVPLLPLRRSFSLTHPTIDQLHQLGLTESRALSPSWRQAAGLWLAPWGGARRDGACCGPDLRNEFRASGNGNLAPAGGTGELPLR